MRSKSILLSVAVFLAAATPSIVFDASRAQVGTADIAEEVDPGFGVEPEENEVEVVSDGANPDPCGKKTSCVLRISEDVEYTSIEGSDEYPEIDKITLEEGATLSLSEGGGINLYGYNDIILNGYSSTIIGNIEMGDGYDRVMNEDGSTIIGNIEMGDEGDDLYNLDHSTIIGNIVISDGKDRLTNQDGSTITSDIIDMRKGGDNLHNKDHSVITSGVIKMGDGNDKLDNHDGSTITGAIDMGAGNDDLDNGFYSDKGSIIAGDINMGAGVNRLFNGNGSIITGAIDMGTGGDELDNNNSSIITGAINMGDGTNELTNLDASTITGNIVMGDENDHLINDDSIITGNIVMGAGIDYLDNGLYDGSATIEGDIDMGAGDDRLVNDRSIITGDIEMGSGGDTLINTNGSTITGNIDMGAGDDQLKNYRTIDADVIDGGLGEDTLMMSGGEIRVYPTSKDEAPIRNFEKIEYTSGRLVIDSSKYTGDTTGDFTIIDTATAGIQNADTLASNVVLEYGENSDQDATFTGYGEANGATTPLKDAYLKQGSLVLVIEDKTPDEIKDDLDPAGGGSSSGGDSIDELLPGCDGEEDLCDIIADHNDDDDASSDDEDLGSEIIDGITDGIDSDHDDIDDLPMIDYGQLAKLVTSGLTPRNVDGPGQSMATYNTLLVDTVFERLPLRQFQVVEQAIEQATFVEEESVEEMQPQQAEPVRGLWMKSAAVDEQQALDYLEQETRQITVAQASGSESASVDGETVITIDDIDYVDRDSLTADYSERDGMRAWFRGFGGSSSAYQTTTLYNDYDISAGGGIVGVDVSIAKNFQLGAYANYGQINLSQNSSDIGGGSWNPSGWGGGITADWWTENFYVQGLLGGTGFSGDQKREIVSIADGWGDETATGDKSATSYLGAVRLGAPFDLGSVLLEPQLTAVWSQNNENSFSESSVRDALQLSYKSRTTNYFQTDLGVKLAYPIKTGDSAMVVPSLKLGWLHDWDQNNAAQKIGYTFTDKTVSVESNQESQNGLLVEAGVDYTVNNFGTTSFKLYGRGGLEFWDANRGTDWRASGGVTFQF